MIILRNNKVISVKIIILYTILLLLLQLLFIYRSLLRHPRHDTVYKIFNEDEKKFWNKSLFISEAFNLFFMLKLDYILYKNQFYISLYFIISYILE